MGASTSSALAAAVPLDRILILTERPPPAEDEPASGLSVRHARMAAALATRGVDATYAWPAEAGQGASGDRSWRSLPLEDPAGLETALRESRPQAVVLGFWGLAGWLPADLSCPVVLDHVAPRLLESQFEDRGRLAGDARALLAVLARCDEAWVGNVRQRDLMTGWMLLAGHDCRFERHVRVVPIAGDPCDRPAASDRGDGPLRLFHGGRDWPWRDASDWLQVLQDTDGPWRLDDGSEVAGLSGHGDYVERLRSADLALELSTDNVERRFSQSFRMTDALCNGVPVVCNRFLPLADVVAEYEAGWLVDSPHELPALLEAVHADPVERERRARNALQLARARLDAEAVYGGLGEALESLVDRESTRPRRPLLAEQSPSRGPGLVGAVRDYGGRWFDHRVRRPLHRRLRRRAADRPEPSDRNGRCWIVVSRPDLFPTDHGAAVKIERTAWGLSFHVDEVLLLTDRRGGYWRYVRGEREVRRFPLRLRLAGWPRAVNLVRLMARGLPYSNAFLYLPLVDRGLNARLFWLLRRHPVEVVQGEFPAYALPAVWASRLFGVRSLLVEHNVEFQRIAEQVPELTEKARAELRRLEIDVANACDRVITVSDRDREALIGCGVRAPRIETIPHGVDLERFEAAEPVDLRARYELPADAAVLVYHGIYSYGPNLDAVRELSEKLLPALTERGVTARVVAVGPEPPSEKLDGVVFTGAVEDLAGYLKGADLAVIPLRAGGGTRMKILDDFAAGVPVVTTAKGMEGIPVADGKHLVVAEEPSAIADAVAALLADPDRRARLADEARAWVSRLDWREIARRYVEAVRRAS